MNKMHIPSFTFGPFEAVFLRYITSPGYAWGYSPTAFSRPCKLLHGFSHSASSRPQQERRSPSPRLRLGLLTYRLFEAINASSRLFTYCLFEAFPRLRLGLLTYCLFEAFPRLRLGVLTYRLFEAINASSRRPQAATGVTHLPPLRGFSHFFVHSFHVIY